MADTAEAQPASEAPGSSSPSIYSGTAKVMTAQPEAKDEGSSPEQSPPPKTDEEPKGDRQPAKQKGLDPEVESEVESRIQKALDKERERAAKAEQEKLEAERAKADQEAKEAFKRYEREAKKLTREAKSGSLEAGEKLIALQVEHFGEALDAPDDDEAPNTEALHAEIQRTVWQHHCESLGVDPDDADFRKVPADKGITGLNEVALSKTTNADLLAAALKNPAAEKLILDHPVVKKLVEAEAEASRNDGLAKGLAGGPKLETPTGGAGKAMTDHEIDLAYYRDPKNDEAAKAWAEKERKAGRL